MKSETQQLGDGEGDDDGDNDATNDDDGEGRRGEDYRMRERE